MTAQTPEYLQSELPAIQLFEKLGYTYLNGSQDDERASINEVILEDRLKSAIKRINPWLNENNGKNAFKEITSVASASLMEANEFIHKFLSCQEYTPKQIVDGKETYRGVSFIDFDNIENNDFLVVNQMKFKGQEKNSIPDLVVFINGMPLAVIECKSPKALSAESEAISDLRYYQTNSEKLFRYNQVCAGIYKIGGRYGAIGAKEKHYQVYRSEDARLLESLLGKEPTVQDILLYNLFEKGRFLDLIRNFIIYHIAEGSKIKILPRYQQIRATNKTIHKLQTDNEGGVVWHTQGSGKSITMVYLATKLRREESGFKNPTIIILTDRTDLDDQISRTFHRCGFPNPIQATSVRHLKKLLEDDYGKTITTTIQKFQETDDEGNIVKVSKEQIEVVSEKENLFVMVDEAHRTQYGFLAGFMRKALKNAKFIAFTGTPIDTEQKSTLGKLQAIARVNRTRGSKPAGLIVDYCGITDHLVAAMEVFSGELEPGDVMVNISEEITKLRLRHNRLVAFFQGLGINRIKNRQEYVDKAVHYLEPEDIRDNFKELLKKFNKSLNIVLPDESALEYKDDFSLYNEIKLEAANAYVDKSLRISKDESKKLQSLIDEHLRAKGITSLLDEPVSIIDVEKFQEEINNTKSGKSKELKRANRIKHTIKTKIDDNPDFYQPLADKLEELIEMRKKNQITQVELFKEFDQIQHKIVNKSKEEVKKSMRKGIKDVLRGKVEPKNIQSITVSLVDLIKRN